MEIYSGSIVDFGFENSRAGREGAFEYVWDLRVDIRDNGLPRKGEETIQLRMERRVVVQNNYHYGPEDQAGSRALGVMFRWDRLRHQRDDEARRRKQWAWSMNEIWFLSDLFRWTGERSAKSPLTWPLHLHDLFALPFASNFLLSPCPIPFGGGFTFRVHCLLSPSLLFPFSFTFPYSLLEINKTRTL